MSKVRIEYVKLNPRAKVPSQATVGAAGADCYACLPEDAQIITILPHTWEFISFGVAVAVPPGYEMQIRARSGLARLGGISLVNGVGTIDSDYRGEIGAIVMNNSNNIFSVKHGDRIAQAVIALVPEVEYVRVDKLSHTARGSGGFGSTGV